MKRRTAGLASNGLDSAFVNRRACLVTGMAALVVVLLQSLPAIASVGYDSSINFYQDGGYVSIDSDDTSDSSISYQSFSGGIGSGWTIANGESFGLTHGHADAANLSMGVFAQSISTPANSHLSDVSISTEVSNRLTVLPGSSGLANGDTTILTLKIRLDGSLHGEATSWPGKGWSHAEMSAGLSVLDEAIQIDTGEGFYTPRQAYFGASSEIEAYDVYLPVWQHSYTGAWEESWRIGSNISDENSHRDSSETTQLSESFHYQADHFFDTGELTLTFEAIVGHTLDFNADMYLYVDAANDAQAWADFDNTFAFDVMPSVDGVSLDWQVVPEPASLSLLAMGMVLLRRRKK